MNRSATFQPKWASVPGETIADILSQKNITIQEFAQQLNSNVDYAKKLLHGYVSINRELAEQLQVTLGGSANFWIKREMQYRESIARLKHIEEAKWLDELPIKDMKKFRWINNSADLIQSCLSYFDVPDVWTWRSKYSTIATLAAFRKSSSINSNPAAIATWLRQGEIQSLKQDCKNWNSQKLKQAVPKIRELIKVKKPSVFIPKLKEILSECGVVLTIVSTPEGCAVSGATKFINESKAMILLSFRHKTDDHLWFTIFHEIGHLLLHEQKLQQEKLIIDWEDAPNNVAEEIEANEFSSELLIPRKLLNQYANIKITRDHIIEIAKKSDVSLGIVVGQLQFNKLIPYNYFNTFKRKFSIEEMYN